MCHSSKQIWIATLSLFSSLLSAQLLAQTNSPESEYRKLITVNQDISPVGDSPFGEHIDLYTGNLSFEVTDISASGIGPTLNLGRMLRLAEDSHNTDGVRRAFGEWSLNLPRIETNTGFQRNVLGWFVGNSGDPGYLSRCTSFRSPPPVQAQIRGFSWSPNQWWYGYHLIVPGHGDQILMHRAAENDHTPSIAAMTYPIVTKQDWMISCGVAASDGGEGFQALSPDGTKYTFAHLVYTALPYIEKPITEAGTSGVHVNEESSNILARRLASMYVTRVEDRFGNALDYGWDGDNLVSITATDGRKLSLTYVLGTPFVQTAALESAGAQSRVWTYSYNDTGSALPSLTRVQLPDGSAWSYQIGDLEATVLQTRNGDCVRDILPDLQSQPVTGSMTQPSGLSATFTITPLLHGRSYVPKSCFGDGGSNPRTYTTIPNAYYQFSLTQEVISGAGVPTETKTWSYSAPNQSWLSDPCASNGTCASSVYTDAVDPYGHDVRYTFSNRYDETEGQLLTTDFHNGGADTTILRSIQSVYSGPVGPWPARYGSNLQTRDNSKLVEQNSPLQSLVVSQDGDTYVWDAEAFDAYANPNKVKRYNSITGQAAIEEQTDHLYDTNNWVIGLPLKVTNLTNGGEVESQNTYDARANPATRSQFGQLLMSYGYDAQGNLTSFTDGNNHTTTLSNYKRGIPQSIGYPDQTSQSLVVDDFGQVTGIIDQAGVITQYTYDPVGRLARIDYTADDTVKWLPKTFRYDFVGSAERGIGANHWRRTITQGSYSDVSYYDAMLRPLIDDTALAGVANSDISTAHAYDWSGQPTFASYPVTGTSPLSQITAGTHWAYDAIHRPIQSSQDSELGTLTTLTTYLSGARKQVTDPKGNGTILYYQVFDTPSYDAVIGVQAPDGVNQRTPRDLYGNVQSIGQSGSYNGQSAGLTRYLIRDSYHRLCRIAEPESGSTVFGYDNANNIVWQATGQSVSGDGSVCGGDQVPSANRTTRTYDAMNRITAETSPSGTQNTTYQYDPVGRLTNTVSGSVIQGRTYNKLGLLTGEGQWLPNDNNYVRTLSYHYDAYGHVDKITYPDGAIIGRFPDPRDRATVVQGGNTFFASNISYYPDGTTAMYSMGNGIAATVQQNARRLPAQVTYSQGGNLRFNEAYSYDANGNPTAVNDLVNGANSQSLGYDELNRLTSASAPNAWGAESFVYDPVNNVRLHGVAGLTLSFNYDGANRLATITQNSPTGGGFANYQYDARGNQTKSTVVFTVTPHTFDAKNQMLSIPGVATYSYDAAGRRIKKVLANGQTSYFLYSQAGALMYAYDVGTGRSTDYLYLNGRLIARTTNNQGTTYVLTDRQGTVARETDANGTVTQSFVYRPFGQLYSGSGKEQPGYTSHVYDPESTLNYMQARYQDGGLGQFLSVDPMAPVAGDVLGFNRYAYGSNNPVGNIDPDGKQSCAQCLYYPPEMAGSYQRQAEINQEASQAGLQSAIGALPVVGDGANIVDAVRDPSVLNVTIAVIGAVPEGGALAGRLLKGAANGERAGKVFTRAGKIEVKEANAAANGGKIICSDCGIQTIPAKQNRAGVTPPGNDAHVDHIIARSKNGNGSPGNGQILCRDCNLRKGDN